MNMKTENWNGHDIRFIEVNNEWWAVAKDVATALGYTHTPHMTRRLDEDEKNTVRLKDSIKKGNPNTIVISEVGIYEAVFGSELKEAKEFKKWVKDVLKTLRQSAGLEGFQIFRMLDKEHQKETMAKLNKSLRKPIKVDFIKANTIANKAVSTKYGFSKMVKKAEMTPEMLQDRQALLDDTVELMSVKEKYNLNLSVKDEIYNSLVEKDKTA